MEHNYVEDVCKIRLTLPNQDDQKSSNCATRAVGKRVENIRNCDIFVADHQFLIYADVQLLKFQSERPINLKELKKIIITYNAKERALELELPCLPAANDDGKSNIITSDTQVHLWKLKRITERCQLLLHDAKEPLTFEANFGYGFASNYKGKICSGESDLSAISHVPAPQSTSPLQRSIDREIDELKNFSRDQYKCDFVELQVPEGHENPVKYTFLYEDYKLTHDEECLLHNLTTRRSPDGQQMIAACDTAEIDCGLLNILMGICYDIRSTSNELTCESAWTRSILSAVLYHFEPFNSMKSTVISFLRRTLIYPLYRNYDFGRICVEDTIKALHNAHACEWVLKQLLVTHEVFASSDCNRDVFNRYYIEDYVRYVHDCQPSHLQMLARNLKNILFDVFKRNLGLDLVKIETELLKELITDIRSNDSTSEEDDSELDDDENDEESTPSSSSSETEENSVIEQQMKVLQL